MVIKEKALKMKVVKLRASDLKDYPELLSRCGAVDMDGKTAYPQHVYISRQDLAKLIINIIKTADKEAPYLKGAARQQALSYHRLNLEPNSSLKDVIKPGYAIVDEERIEAEKCTLSQEDAISTKT